MVIVRTSGDAWSLATTVGALRAGEESLQLRHQRARGVCRRRAADLRGCRDGSLSTVQWRATHVRLPDEHVTCRGVDKACRVGRPTRRISLRIYTTAGGIIMPSSSASQLAH